MGRNKGRRSLERLKELTSFKDKHGHMDVKPKDDSSLANFCRQARYARKETNNLKLKDEQITALDALGFDWSTRERTRKSFEERLQDLKAYKEQNSHMNVKPSEDKSLASFCTNIRQARKNLGQSGYMKLTEERISALDGIGFDWRGDFTKSSVGAEMFLGDTSNQDSTQKIDDHHKHGNEEMISLVMSNDRAAKHDEMPYPDKTRDEIPFGIGCDGNGKIKSPSNTRLNSPSVSSAALDDLGFNWRVETEQMDGIVMSLPLPSGLASSAAGPPSFQLSTDLFTEMELTEAKVAPLADGMSDNAIISHIDKPGEKSYTAKDSARTVTSKWRLKPERRMNPSKRLMAYVNNKEVAPSGDNIKLNSQQNVANSVAQIELTSGDEVQHLDEIAQGEDDLAEAISDLLNEVALGEDNTIISPSGEANQAKVTQLFGKNTDCVGKRILSPNEGEKEDTAKSSTHWLNTTSSALTAGQLLLKASDNIVNSVAQSNIPDLKSKDAMPEHGRVQDLFALSKLDEVDRELKLAPSLGPLDDLGKSEVDGELKLAPALGPLLNDGAKNSVDLEESNNLGEVAQGEETLAGGIGEEHLGDDASLDAHKSSMLTLHGMAPAFTAGTPLQPNTVLEVVKHVSRPMISCKCSKGPVEVSTSTELVREAGSSVQQLEKIEDGSLKVVEPDAKDSARDDRANQPTTPKQQEVTAYVGEWWHRLDKNPKPRRKAAKHILYKEPTLSQKLRSGDTFFPCRE